MSDFTSRLQNEREELSDKIDKLHVFIKSENYKNIDIEQQALLPIQLKVMQSYDEILRTRIELLP